MRPKTIGVLGGAGPLAGALLFERMLRHAQNVYGCFRDEDFPKIILINFPFSDMLSLSKNKERVQKELNLCLNELKKAGAEILVIACNTLHAFLSDKPKELIHLPDLANDPNALVLASSTSVESCIFSGVLPSREMQQELDEIIIQILKGEEHFAAVRLSALIQNTKKTSLILGCTEFSLIARELWCPGKIIIDPLEIASQIIIQRSFR